MGSIGFCQIFHNDNKRFPKVTKANSSYSGWKHILDHIKLLRKGLICVLVNGGTINLWYDNWLGEAPLVTKILPDKSHLINHNAKVSDLFRFKI